MTIAIIVALVVIAVVTLVALTRGKGGSQLQAPSGGPTKAIPAKRPPTPAADHGIGEQARRAPDAGSARRESARSAGPAPEPAAAGGAAPAASLAPSKRDIAGLRRGLAATRGGFIAKLSALFQSKKDIDPAILEELEGVMLASDVGPKTTQAILARLRESLERSELRSADAVWTALRAEATRILGIGGGAIRVSAKPTVVLLVGVNGAGKTTTIGKLATRYTAAGKKVILAAGDTFRAAAVQQLEVWGKRVGADVVRGKEGADPGAVAFEATTRAKDGSVDLLFIDTAGRLHTKAPLMDEIKKVRKTIAKAMEGAPHETLLVLDATNGQNALRQAAMFKEALDLTGIVLTKLDGTAKGGIVLGICDELGVPVRYVGLGERPDDLREFHVEEFVEALFGRVEDEVAAA
jgi:fused signal recognition particle receptor